jgi:CubicO group peptidase (beta-lactamase class C family)
MQDVGALLHRVGGSVFPAIAAAGVKDGQIVLLGSAGNAIADSTAFLIASITKTFVGALCMQCKERGELDLDINISHYLPDECQTCNPHFPNQPITPRHLLMHSSGLRDDEEALTPHSKYHTEGSDSPITLQQYVQERLCGSNSGVLWSCRAEPGASYHYSNAGFTLLGLVVANAAKLPLEVLARERIFEPIGMERTGWFLGEMGAKQTTDKQLNLAVPHTGCTAAAATAIGHYGVTEFPAAQIRSTAMDLGLYLAALTAAPGECPILTDESRDEMMPPASAAGNHKVEKGLAWWGADATYGEKSGDSWTHGGFMPGVRSHAYLWPAHRAGLVLLTNGEGDYTGITRALKAELGV